MLAQHGRERCRIAVSTKQVCGVASPEALAASHQLSNHEKDRDRFRRARRSLFRDGRATRRTDSNAPIGQMQLTVITRDKSTNLFTAYIDGVAQLVVNDGGGYGIFSNVAGLAHCLTEFLADNGTVEVISTSHTGGDGD